MVALGQQINSGQLKELIDLFYWLIIKEQFVISKAGTKTVELLMNKSIWTPLEPVFNFYDYKTNVQYAEEEIAWYRSESLNINDMKNPPKIWKNVSDKDGFINSNYGHLVFSLANGDQRVSAVNALLKDPSSRQAVLVYIRPSIHREYNKNGMYDFICTTHNQFFIRNGYLEMLYCMRSNDFWFGFRNDFYWACYLYNLVYNDLKVKYTDLKIGSINWFSGSLHVYENQFNKIISTYKKMYQTPQLNDQGLNE